MAEDDLLYHYTSAQGLLGLLGAPAAPAKLWMTQIHYQNDAAEARHAYELTAYELRRLENRCPNLKRAAAGFYGVPAEGQQWQAPSGFAVTRECTFSLSEDGDLLSQWRGYAASGGYSVGYRFGEIANFARHEGLRLSRCIYDEAEQRDLIANELIAIEDAFVRGETEGALPGVPDHDRARATASVRFQRLGHRLAPTFKHPSFAEEREWRLIGMIGVNDPRARYRTKDNIIVPYGEIDIDPRSARYPLRPVEIIVGPGVDFELATQTIGYLTFNFSNPEQQPKLIKSQSTLRART